MEHYLGVYNNESGKYSEWELKEAIHQRKDGVYRVPFFSHTGRTDLLMRKKGAITLLLNTPACSKRSSSDVFMAWNPKRIWAAIKTTVLGCASLKVQRKVGRQEAGRVQISKPVRTEKEPDTIDGVYIQYNALQAKLFKIFEKDEKLKKYRRIGMKAVKDKDALQKIVDSWFASSKNLWKLIDCGMSSTVKIGLGYGNNQMLSDGELGAVFDHSVNDDPIHDHIPIPSIEQVQDILLKEKHVLCVEVKSTLNKNVTNIEEMAREAALKRAKGWIHRLLAKASSDEAKLWHRRSLVMHNSSAKWVAERMNRTLRRGARTMLADSTLTTIFGAEESILLAYTYNRTEEAADLMVVSSTSLTEATRNAASSDDIMTFRKELDALALKHLGPVPATAPTSTNPVNTGSDNLNTSFEEVTPGNIEAISPSANHEEEVFSDADDDENAE
ncbi:hypothetical protein Tco_0790188 [Tanacetum coccineum]